MRRILAEYDAIEDPVLKSEYLDAHGRSFATIMTYRKIVARADRRSAPAPVTATVRIRATRRRTRRGPTSPSSRAYETTRPGDSPRNRGGRDRVTVVIIFDFPSP
ncbi:hypothetical protein [Streptomyces sp. NPDC050121]|uniref:hypothetical protein n=1 Tax=Streptomyces sp. NPDC050121 TaxID=3365601 RepID=UPI003795D997